MELRKNPLTIVLVVLTLVLLVGIQPTWARSYNFDLLRIEAELLPDGRLMMEEHRTVTFDGQFSGLYQSIDTSAGIKVEDIQIREGDQLYERNPTTDIGPPGTFFVRRSPNEVYIDWSYSASNETRVFTLTYTLEDVIRLHNDVGELYHKWVGDRWDQGVSRVDVLLTLPEGADASDLRAWGHGPLHGLVEIVNGRQVRWTIDNLPGSTFLEGRVTFPTDLIEPNAPYAISTGRSALDGILAEEQAWAREANLARWAQRFQWVLAFVVLLGSVFLGIRTFLKWGRNFKTDFTGDYYRELPQEYSPAEMSVLYYKGSVGTKDLTATVLDLARRGWLKIEEVTVEKKGLLRRGEETDYVMTRQTGKGSLVKHENELLDFFFKTVAAKDEEKVSFKDLEAFAKKRKTTFAKFWSSWQASVKAEAEKHGFFDKTNTKARQKMGLVGFGLGALSFGGFFLQWLALGFSLMISGVILIFLAALMSRRSRTGAEDYVKWQGFRRFLLHFSEMQRNEIPSLIIWEHYLVYAAALNVASQVLKQLNLVYPGLEDSSGHRFGYGWYYMGARGGMGSFDKSFNQLTTSMQNSFRQSISTATSQSSSGSGGGGGFSGGGGGGSGGGGGGVR